MKEKLKKKERELCEWKRKKERKKERNKEME